MWNKTIKFVGEKAENAWDYGVDQEFSDFMPKAQSIQEKRAQLHLIDT